MESIFNLTIALIPVIILFSFAWLVIMSIPVYLFIRFREDRKSR